MPAEEKCGDYQRGAEAAEKLQGAVAAIGRDAGEPLDPIHGLPTTMRSHSHDVKPPFAIAVVLALTCAD
jgi:hypothetical protein